METHIYKLGEYKITEDYTGELRWEAHFGLGALKEGRCYKKGAILFLGPAEGQRDGFLKLEYVDHLRGSPDWMKTKYYCDNPEVFHCKTGAKVSSEEMRLWMVDRSIHKGEEFNEKKSGQYCNNIDTTSSIGDVAFRLQRFEIIKKSNGQIEWKTYGGAVSLRTGLCRVMEDIIFIGPLQNEQTNLPKQEFLANLKLLPEWNQTKYYCPSLSLHDCSTANKRWKEEKRRLFKWRKATKTHRIRNGYKKLTELKITAGMKHGIFSERKLPTFDSLTKQARGYKSYISKIIAAFRTSSIKKWIINALALIFFIALSFLAFLIGYLKERYKRWHDRKGKHSSSH